DYGEPWAPERADALTLGDSMYFYTQRRPHPVKFVKPAFAIDIATAGIPQVRIDRLVKTPEPYGCELWWLEYGGLLHAIYDAEQIKSHLTCLIYGVWDFIKNSGRVADTENLTLEWVCSLPGKREGRRFIGDHVLTQQDVLAQRDFPDGIGAAGWSIDLHPSGGIYCADPASMHGLADWVYNVPFRCLYSRNVENLLLAGRLISASHVAFGSIRVMGTGAMTGQAIGTAAAQCIATGLTPREIANTPEQINGLRQRLIRDGQHIAGLTNTDPADLARTAKVTASSAAVLDARTTDEWAVSLAKGGRWLLPLADPATEWVELLVSADGETSLECELLVNNRIVNYEPNVSLGKATVALAAGKQWIRIPLLPGRTDVRAATRHVPASTPSNPAPASRGVPAPVADLTRPQNVWLTFASNAKVELRCQRATTCGALYENFAFRAGFHPRSRGTPCFRLARPQKLYAPQNVIDGHHRPFVFPHAWVSEPLSAGPQWLELELPAAARVGEVQITLNANPDQLIWTQLFPADCRTLAETLRDFDVELFDEAGRRVAKFEVRDNHQALVRLPVPGQLVDRHAPIDGSGAMPATAVLSQACLPTASMAGPPSQTTGRRSSHGTHQTDCDALLVKRLRITALAACGHDRAEICEVRMTKA
ncbi:MAG: FAD-dependent oxidoreductase, partial [Phycisphaerae bacterium]|nr:FAD-dependent oxidoreductase [Phycisphaerae bacterium]